MYTDIEYLWEEFSVPLKAFIKRRVNSDQDAEDILQNVFYKIHFNISNLNNTDKIHAWIYKITNNAIVDFYRTQKNETLNTEFFKEIVCEVQEEENVNEEIIQCLKTMIQYLPEKYKQALILTEFQNLSQKDLAEKLGLSVSGAKSRVQRARVKLKEMLLGCCQLEFDHFGNVIEYQRQCNDCKYC